MLGKEGKESFKPFVLHKSIQFKPSQKSYTKFSWTTSKIVFFFFFWKYQQRLNGHRQPVVLSYHPKGPCDGSRLSHICKTVCSTWNYLSYISSANKKTQNLSFCQFVQSWGRRKITERTGIKGGHTFNKHITRVKSQHRLKEG